MNKKITIYIILIIFLSGSLLNAEGYQYQYFSAPNRYLPFSDYIPEIRLHYKTVPHYVEDFYLLYGKKQYYNENTLRKNIQRLKIALDCRFRHPSNALVKVETEEEYLKYRKLMHMHINLLIMRNHMRIASRYDKQKIYFYSGEFEQEIKESLEIADKFYKEALPYWEEAKRLALEASQIRITTDLGIMESERYSITKGDLDFERIINRHISKLDQKRAQLDSYARRNQ